ncbi:hypothetical protein IWZ03DRAFT_179609 [Phyllosticta citriasiana]|uniref:Uncharacterized protein n=1 Tax=Phyllosticta citriasiana TaxID=595635 RepID=A0ABR1KMM8_9PEZI
MRSVASTTLLTFRVDVPLDAFSVELRGSWDNFNHSYHLQQDLRRSSTNWVGIFTFKDIICDGDSDGPAEKREGCLSMGGTYWYHYLVNGVYEFCDQAQPSTTRCPFLPGEDLNILHVPREEAADVLQDGFSELSADTPAFTWNPQARYSTPRPNKFEALAQKAQPPPPSPSYPSPVTPSCENPASFDFFPAQSSKRPSAGSVRKSPDGNERPPSRNPSAQPDSRPWTSSDDNSMKSARVREKTSQLLRRARSLTTIARKISQKQRKRNRPDAASTHSSVPRPIQEKSTEDLPLANQETENGRNVSTSSGTVGCWAHQDCWQSAGPQTCRNEQEASRQEIVASWMEFQESPDDFHDNYADPWSRQERPETEGQGDAPNNCPSDEQGMAGNEGIEHQVLRRSSRPTSRTSQSPSSPRQFFDWVQLPGEEKQSRGDSDPFEGPQEDEASRRHYDATSPHVLYRGRRSSHGRPPLPNDFEHPMTYAFDNFLYDPWGGVGNYEVQESNPGLDYAYSDDAYDERDQFNGDSREQDPAYTWGPVHWQPQNLAADMARMPTVHAIHTDGPDHFSEEGDPVAYPDEEDIEDAAQAEIFPDQARQFDEQCPDQSPDTEDIQQESPPRDDGSWTNAAPTYDGPLRRFRSIIERYRHASSSPGSVHTEDETRETNPSTPTQDKGFLGYMLPEEESTSQVTLTKVSTHATVVRKNSFANAPQLELNLDGGELGDWSSFSSMGELEKFSF